MLLLTFDLSLDGRSQMPKAAAGKLLESLEDLFVVDPLLESHKELDRMDRTEEILTTDHVRRSEPDLLPWKHRLLKAVYDLLRGRGWTGGFYSLSCYCLEARRKP